jgi:PiT family inorganic phosphate transporter
MTLVLVLAMVGSIFVAFNNGANDVANAFASAVGAKALKVKHALLIAAVLNLLGAILLGSNVSKTLIDRVADIRHFDSVNDYVAGMLACMVASGSFIFISTHTGLPVSSTHTIVGGMIGVSMVIGGVDAVNWRSLSVLTLSWVLTPFLSAACSLAMLKLIRLTIYREGNTGIMERACFWLPIFANIVLFSAVAAIFHGIKLCNRLSHCENMLWFALLAIIPMYAFFRTITYRLTIKFKDRGDFAIEHVFRRFQAGTSCLIGFAIGSNDVANSVMPVIAIYFVTKLSGIPGSFADYQIPVWMLALGGIGMSVGVLSLGHKVIGTLGRSIALLTNSRGFSVDCATAMTIIMASVFGIPISSTHAATGAIMGVGMENGPRGLNLRLLLKIFITWLITVPSSAIFTILVYLILRLVPFVSL